MVYLMRLGVLEKDGIRGKHTHPIANRPWRVTRKLATSLTVGRTLVVSDKRLPSQKTIVSQKAACQAEKKRASEMEAELAKANLRNADARNRLHENKIGAYAGYAQSHARLPGGAFRKCALHRPNGQKRLVLARATKGS